MVRFFEALLRIIFYLILIALMVAALSLIIDFILWIWDIEVNLW